MSHACSTYSEPHMVKMDDHTYWFHADSAYVFSFLLYNKMGASANIYRGKSLIVFDKPVNIY